MKTSLHPSCSIVRANKALLPRLVAISNYFVKNNFPAESEMLLLKLVCDEK
jgi:hypothetical protein